MCDCQGVLTCDEMIGRVECTGILMCGIKYLREHDACTHALYCGSMCVHIRSCACRLACTCTTPFFLTRLRRIVNRNTMRERMAEFEVESGLVNYVGLVRAVAV